MENKTWKIYMLRLANGAYYTGITNNLSHRVEVHKKGKGSRYVRAHRPFKIVYVESAANKSTALKREAAIKKLSHSKKEEMIKCMEQMMQD